MTFYYFGLFIPHANRALQTAGLDRGYHFGGDLYPLWLTSQQILQRRTNPYQPETTRQIQAGLYGRPLDTTRGGNPGPGYRAFAYPLYADIPTFPLALLPFPVVRAVAAFLFPLVVIWSCWLWTRFLKLPIKPWFFGCFLLLMVTSYPVLEGFYSLQPSLIVSLLLAGTGACLVRGRLTMAGILLAMASVKPQLIVIVALWLLLWTACDFARRRNFAFGFFATLALLFSASPLLVPGWLHPWIHSLIDYRQYTDPALPQFVLGVIAGTFLSLILIVAAVALAYRARRVSSESPQFALTFALLLTITVLVIPSSIAVYEQILLVPAVLCLIGRIEEIFGGGPPLRILGYATGATLSWQWISASSIALFFALVPGIRSDAWIMLPLRTAAAIPFEVVALGLFIAWKGKGTEKFTLARFLQPNEGVHHRGQSG